MLPVRLQDRPALMIVDDDSDQLGLFRLAAERTGAYSQIVTAENGVIALRKLLGFVEETADSVPIVVLADLKMPHIGGAELARRLRRHTSLPIMGVVAMSSTHNEPEVELALNAGCVAFVEKPSSFSQTKGMMVSLPKICSQFPPAPERVPERFEAAASQ